MQNPYQHITSSGSFQHYNPRTAILSYLRQTSLKKKKRTNHTGCGSSPIHSLASNNLPSAPSLKTQDLHFALDPQKVSGEYSVSLSGPDPSATFPAVRLPLFSLKHRPLFLEPSFLFSPLPNAFLLSLVPVSQLGSSVLGLLRFLPEPTALHTRHTFLS